ncbi:hypothetical protein PENSUB_2474 [Penicillium subrubescens]|uniref:Uncharacterized protein n=1 Tax=Penicillium subrubescens TaxID=1316194 RepID=A0A1Q5UHI4_9EURO|nr:hypothetical protein PENSUB_2474 [Penicillium subrubescens]
MSLMKEVTKEVALDTPLAGPTAALFFVRSSLVHHRRSVPDQEAWLAKFCVELHSHLVAQFGGFNGPTHHVVAVQCAIKKLKNKYRKSISDFLNNHRDTKLVELVVAGRDGLHTDKDYFRGFLEYFNGTDWRDFALTSKRGHDAPEIHFCGQCPKRYSGYKSWYDRYIKAHGKQTSIYLGVEIIDMDEIQG